MRSVSTEIASRNAAARPRMPGGIRISATHSALSAFESIGDVRRLPGTLSLAPHSPAFTASPSASLAWIKSSSTNVRCLLGGAPFSAPLASVNSARFGVLRLDQKLLHHREHGPECPRWSSHVNRNRNHFHRDCLCSRRWGRSRWTWMHRRTWLRVHVLRPLHWARGLGRCAELGCGRAEGLSSCRHSGLRVWRWA